MGQGSPTQAPAARNLKVKLEKLSFFRPEVSYLGLVTSKDGVSTDHYYRRFIEGFSKPFAPLHHLFAELTSGKFQKLIEISSSTAWMEGCEQNFEGLKSRLASAPVLAYADFSLPFILEQGYSNTDLKGPQRFFSVIQRSMC